ncbi:MAG: excinuclease ABC subunit UvrA [Candidatus Pacebacteria bacterium]|nr:excinuclease ABC subunit UvrA [Candidatus Paceibacterota bacterium]
MSPKAKKNNPESLRAFDRFGKEASAIYVRGARTHNLKNIDVTIPRNTLTAITGLSGSGKSSLAFDTIFAEGQRRYVESLSAYARQFLSQMGKPDVDEITGLSPAISIDQKTAPRNPRSTVATMTEIYDYMRVLFARLGRPYSPISGAPIKKMTNDEIIALVQAKVKALYEQSTGKKKIMDVEFDNRMVRILAPVIRGRKGEYYQLLYDALGKGFSHARIDGVLHNLREQIVLAKHKKHDIELVVDAFAVHELIDHPADVGLRLAEAVERALAEADGLITIVFESETEILEEILVSAKLISPEDGYSFPEIEPRMFSFNSPYGACPTCNGLGTQHLFGNEHDDLCKVCKGGRLREEAYHVLLGSEDQARTYAAKISEATLSVPREVDSKKWTRKGLNIFELTQLSIFDVHEFILGLDLPASHADIAAPLLNEIESRLQFMINVGLDYLSLNRRANTLSGGEAQRIRLASQLGSQLVGALYVLDEPTIGLHQRDNDRLIKTLLHLRDLGNTIIVVEHDEDTLYAADYIVDIGPGAGRHGGHVVVQGYVQELLDAPTNPTQSVTLDYLRRDTVIPLPEVRRTKDKGELLIKGASINNIHNLDVRIPLGKLVVISGVSGSGKSSFMYQVLDRNLKARYDRRYRSAKAHNCAQFIGDDSLSRTILVDQSPIGRTPRSNPATYTGAWTHIRDLFASSEEARLRGWKANRFSFNVKGGRCENCQGRGEIAVEMHFLPTVYVQCDICEGKRFDKETLQVKYKKKNIYEVLEMTIEEAYEFFHDIPAIAERLHTLLETGLSYLKLGQPANTLSGGESQRVKISSELYRPMTQKTIYLLDEPTVGLHFADVAKLIDILNRLIDRGNTVVVIEHNLEIIKCADYILDFGPEGGSGGGHIVAQGTPEDVANNPASHTGKYLDMVLRSHKKAAKTTHKAKVKKK